MRGMANMNKSKKYSIEEALTFVTDENFDVFSIDTLDKNSSAEFSGTNENDLNIFSSSVADKVCNEAFDLIGDVTDILTIPLHLLKIPNLVKNDTWYRMPQKEIENMQDQINEEQIRLEKISKEQISEEESEESEVSEDFDNGDKDFVPDLSDLSDDELENVKESQNRCEEVISGNDDTHLSKTTPENLEKVHTNNFVVDDLEEGDQVHLCGNDGTHLFKATVCGMGFSTMVHNCEILEHHGRFLITHCNRDALEKWCDYDPD